MALWHYYKFLSHILFRFVSFLMFDLIAAKFSPAMHHHRTGIGRITGFHTVHKSQDRSGMLGNTVIGPSGELELTNLPLFSGSTLRSENKNRMLD